MGKENAGDIFLKLFLSISPAFFSTHIYITWKSHYKNKSVLSILHFILGVIDHI